MQVIHMLVWGEFDSIFTFLCMQVSIMMFWIELDFDPLLHAGDHLDVLD